MNEAILTGFLAWTLYVVLDIFAEMRRDIRTDSNKSNEDD